MPSVVSTTNISVSLNKNTTCQVGLSHSIWHILSFLFWKYVLETAKLFPLVNSHLSIAYGWSLFYCQYLIINNLLKIDIKDPKWVHEVYSDQLIYNDFTGGIIDLYSHDYLASFGSVATDSTGGNVTSCNQVGSRCIGNYVPTSRSLAFFSMKHNSNVFFWSR